MGTYAHAGNYRGDELVDAIVNDSAALSDLAAALPGGGVTEPLVLVDDLTTNGVKVGRGTGNVASNTAVGNGAIESATTGARNTGVGQSALQSATTGSDNTAVGRSALSTLDTGTENVAVGKGALSSNTSGPDNTAIGTDAIASNETGYDNVAVGAQALVNWNGPEGSNTDIGTAAGFDATTGKENVAVGAYTRHGTTGEKNTVVGCLAGHSVVTGSRNLILGHGAELFNGADNDKVVIGDATLEAAIVSVEVGGASTHKIRIKFGGHYYDLLAIQVP